MINAILTLYQGYTILIPSLCTALIITYKTPSYENRKKGISSAFSGIV